MSNRQLVGLLLLATAFSGVRGVAQEANPPADRKARPHVVVIGASVSAGFADPTSKGKDGEVNRTYKLDEAFKKVWPTGVARISNFGDMMMFMQPVTRGEKQLASAKKRKADLVLGIDFLTWFGYGSAADRSTKEGEVDGKRMALQAKGLAMLEGITCPIVVGDYPDMHGASSHMLPASMIPNVATLKALNEKLYDWAKTRKNVFVCPLAKFTAEAVSKKQTYPYGDGKVVELPKNFVLQSDRLHATRIGALIIVLRVIEALPNILPAKHALLAPGVTFKSLVEAANLEDDIPAPIPIKSAR